MPPPDRRPPRRSSPGGPPASRADDGARPDARRPDENAGKRPFPNRRPPPPSRKEPAPRPIQEAMRLNRYLAQSGVASRRKADELIAGGAVTVNGVPVMEMGAQVQPGDRVAVHGKAVSPAQHLYLLLNKPDDTITTKSDEKGRFTVLDLIDLPEEEKGALFPVGRLDRHTVGVLLLTTDGELAHRLTHPSFEVEKLYIVRTARSVKPHELDDLRRGVRLDDGPARADQAAYVSDDHHEIGLSIHEGRNRIVRRMMEALGHEVVQLERIRYADLTTSGVRRGKWRRLSPGEVKKLQRLVGLKN